MSGRPASQGDRTSRRLASGLMARGLGALLVALPFAPGLLDALGWPRLGAALDRGWAPFCHRIPARCLDFLGAPMPLCSRCLGLVLGLGAGLLIGWPVLPFRRLLGLTAVSSLLMLLEVGTQELGLHEVFHPTRLLSGLILAYPIGAAATAVVLGGQKEGPPTRFPQLTRNRRT